MVLIRAFKSHCGKGCAHKSTKIHAHTIMMAVFKLLLQLRLPLRLSLRILGLQQHRAEWTSEGTKDETKRLQ